MVSYLRTLPYGICILLVLCLSVESLSQDINVALPELYQIITNASEITPAPLMSETPDASHMSDTKTFTDPGIGIQSINQEKSLFEHIAGAYLQYWNGTEKDYPPLTLSVMADEGTSSWGNFGMAAMGAYPRPEYDPTIHDRQLMITPWVNLYSAINSAKQVLAAINDGETIFNESNQNVTDRALAFAHFVKGVSYGFLAQYYEGGYIYILDDFNFENAVFVGYEELRLQAISSLQDALAHSNFTGLINWISLPSEYLLHAENFAKLTNSYIARIIINTTRNQSERDAIDWNQIVQLTNDGIDEDFVVRADAELWWNRNTSIAQHPTWMRTNYTVIGKYDVSGEYENWLNTPITERQEFILNTPDRRITGDNNTTDPGTDFIHRGPSPFSPLRGTWRFSRYSHYRYEDVLLNGFIGPMPHMLVAEMDLYRAEAYLRLGQNTEDAVALINKTRVNRGQLPPATTDNSTQELMDMLFYERGIEVMNTASGLAFFDRRSREVLMEGTTTQFPASMVAPPVMVSPLPNSVNNPTDLTIELSYLDQAFYSVPDQFNIEVAIDPDFTTTFFASTNNPNKVIELPELEGGTVYYVRLQGVNSQINRSSFFTTFLFATELSTLTIQEINEYYIDNDFVDLEMVQVEGVVISPVINFNGAFSFWVDDGTGGSFVRLNIDFDEYDLTEGDVVKVGGKTGRIWSFHLVIDGAGFELIDTDAPLPSHTLVTIDELVQPRAPTGNRFVEVKNVELVSSAAWPVTPIQGSVLVSLREWGTDNSFHLQIFNESELNGSPAPAGVFHIKGINGSLGIVTFYEDDIVMAPLSPPVVLRPDNNAEAVGINPRMRWNSAIGVHDYHFQLSENSTFDNLIYNIEEVNDTTYRSAGLSYETVYYWRTRGRYTAGYSAWSEVFSFTTIEAPEVPPDTQQVAAGDSVVTVFQVMDLTFAGTVTTSSNVTVTVYDTPPYDGDLPPGVLNVGGFYIEIIADDIEFENGKIAIPITHFPDTTDFDTLVWLKRSASGDAWEDIGGEVIDGYFVSTIPFDSFSEFTTGVLGDPTSIPEERRNIPMEYVLKQNYPNPFNPMTTIRFVIPERHHVLLSVYNILGQEVARLVDDITDAGYHDVIFDASHLPSGMYIYRLQAGEYMESKKLIYLK